MNFSMEIARTKVAPDQGCSLNWENEYFVHEVVIAKVASNYSN